MKILELIIIPQSIIKLLIFLRDSINSYQNMIELLVGKIFNTFHNIIKKEDFIFICWYNKKNKKNWGDALNPIIVSNLARKKAIYYKSIIRFHDEEMDVYSVIGSILGEFDIQNLIIWGSGFISEKSILARKPKSICAVRGPLTRQLLLSQGFKCPEIYGDPALLYPLYYKPVCEKKYKLGIIPHYIDKKNAILKTYYLDKSVKIIDIFGDTNSFIDDICQCEIIASSSLHGLIMSDTYGIPSIWIEISDKIIGNKFKFYDYFASINRKESNPLRITKNISTNDIINEYKKYEMSIDIKALLNACPFLDPNQKRLLQKKMIGTWMESGKQTLEIIN